MATRSLERRRLGTFAAEVQPQTEVCLFSYSCVSHDESFTPLSHLPGCEWNVVVSARE